MVDQLDGTPDDGPAQPGRWWCSVAAAAVWVSFCVYSAVCAPIPAVNEPHYLAKAKHYWDPAWCAGDLFLESADAHLVFYQSVGWLTRLLTLEQTAIVGRAVGLGLLACGWRSLISRLAPGRWTAIWAAWCFLALASLGNLSGEWLVGGIEAKVFAYGWVFLSLAAVLERRWIAAGITAGLAVSFHPIVGIWSLACGAFAALLGIVIRRSKPQTEVAARATAPQIGLAALLLLVCSLPGLWPAVNMLRAANPDEARMADFIQVGYRLKHHLDPLLFPASAYAAYAVLIVFWGTSRRLLPRTPGEAFLARFVGGTLLLAAVGLAIAWGPRPLERMPLYETRMWPMKFYPFRLADVMIPLAASVAAAGVAEQWCRRPSHTDATVRRRPARFAWLVFLGYFAFSLFVPTEDRNPSRMDAARLGDWKHACRWIAAETPPDARFVCSKGSWAFKWYAGRPEYVAFKDCPQDAAGIVEWNRRLRRLSQWAKRRIEDGFSDEELRELRELTGADYFVVSRLGPFESEPVFRNGHFRVYHLPK